MNYAKEFSELTELRGRRVTLKPVQANWAEPLFKMVHESRVELRRYMAWETDDLEATRTFLEGAVRDREAGTGLSLAIFEANTSNILGVIGLMALNPFTPKAEVGYSIHSKKTSCGYATESLSTLIDYCRDTVKLVRLDAQVATTNVASQRVMAKCGFKEEGLKPKSLLCHGTWHDMKLYGKLLD
jgi:ribosomal-protein-alanine N-acetyltransferase